MWLAVAIVGVVVFLVGIWVPAYAHLPKQYRQLVQIAVAGGGGALFILGLSYWYDARSLEAKRPPRARPLTGRAKEIAIAPSFEVYNPKLLPDAPRTPALPEPAGPKEPTP